MARISIYDLDTNITARDKVIGTDFTGSVTKNFPLKGIAELFGRGLLPIHTQTGYRFSDILEEMTFSGPDDGDSFSSLTSLKFSEIDGSEQNIQDFILEYNNKRVILFDNTNKNNYGIYTVSNLVEDTENPGYFIFTLAHNSSNGVLVLDNYYSLAIYSADLHYTHHQNNDATTWTINHNLGKFPSVSIKFSSSDQVYENVGAFAGVQYIDKNTLTINLAAAQSGYAYLN
jgi:hypothetical protein